RDPSRKPRAAAARLRPARRAVVDRHHQDALRTTHHRGVRGPRNPTRRRPGMTTATLLSAATLFALACVVLAMILCTLRLMIGPSAQDRVLALDTLWMCTMLLMLMLGIRHGSQIYFEAALLIALLGFVSTIVLAKFLMRGEVIE